MGYYTLFTLDYLGSDIDDKLLKEFNRIFKCDNWSLEGVFCNSLKWYSYKEDMIEISKLFPEHYFMLYGEGEDHEDNWKCGFHNGEVEQVWGEIHYPKFENENFNKL